MYAKISGHCHEHLEVSCGRMDKTICSSPLLCSQLHDWCRTLHRPSQYCELITPVIDGGKPYVTEVFFEKPIPSLHRKPPVTGYRAGNYELGSKDYLYNPSRRGNKYWTKELGWHTNQVFPNLDNHVAEFKHEIPQVLSHQQGCYRLNTAELYCPRREGHEKYFSRENGFYAKPTAPSPAVAEYLERKAQTLAAQGDAFDKEAIVTEYLRCYRQGNTVADAQVHQDENKRGALLSAVVNRHNAIVKLLLHRAKVDPDHRGHERQTPLMMAAAAGNVAIVKLLLETGRVDPDAKNDNGRTPLWLAGQNGHDAVVKLLLDSCGEPRCW